MPATSAMFSWLGLRNICVTIVSWFKFAVIFIWAVLTLISLTLGFGCILRAIAFKLSVLFSSILWFDFWTISLILESLLLCVSVCCGWALNIACVRSISVILWSVSLWVASSVLTETDLVIQVLATAPKSMASAEFWLLRWDYTIISFVRWEIIGSPLSNRLLRLLVFKLLSLSELRVNNLIPSDGGE